MSTCDLKPQQPKWRLPVEVGSLELGAGAQPGSGAAAREFYEGKGRQKILAKAKEAVSSLVSDETFTIFRPLKINMEHNHGGLEDHFPF